MRKAPTQAAEPPLSPADLAVVVLVSGARNVTSIRRMLAGDGIENVVAEDIESLLDRIRRGCGPILASAEAIDDHVTALCDVLDAQDRWSDLPVILFNRSQTPLPSSFAPLIDRSNTTLLREPVQTATIVTVVRSALADRRRQYAFRDVLDDLERLNRRYERRIVQLQRLTFQLSRAEERERRRLAALLHDDLQQLLVSAQYRLSVLSRRAGDGRDVEETVSDLREQLSQAITRSRNLSHQLSPPPLRRQTLGEALHWLAGQTTGAHGLEVTIRGEVGKSLASEDLEILAYRAVQELLFNVVKHADTDRAWIELSSDGVRLKIVVGDEGRGFAPAAEVSDPDVNAGLGLFGISERAHALGGELQVESEPGRGCRCTLVLPLRQPVDGDSSRPQSAAVDGEGPGAGATPPAVLRVVIVDDHRYLREGVKALLAEESDVEVVGEAADGLEALDMVRRHAPDVVLLDVAMPVMNGIEAVRRLRHDYPQLRIIGLSTFGHDDMGQRMREAGADAYVCKSDPGDALVDAVRGATDR